MRRRAPPPPPCRAHHSQARRWGRRGGAPVVRVRVRVRGRGRSRVRGRGRVRVGARARARAQPLTQALQRHALCARHVESDEGGEGGDELLSCRGGRRLLNGNGGIGVGEDDCDIRRDGRCQLMELDSATQLSGYSRSTRRTSSNIASRISPRREKKATVSKVVETPFNASVAIPCLEGDPLPVGSPHLERSGLRLRRAPGALGAAQALIGSVGGDGEACAVVGRRRLVGATVTDELDGARARVIDQRHGRDAQEVTAGA
eukprot:scaffold124921_cov59-Phaeocystis_antarctica.AAC.3